MRTREAQRCQEFQELLTAAAAPRTRVQVPQQTFIKDKPASSRDALRPVHLSFFLETPIPTLEHEIIAGLIQPTLNWLVGVHSQEPDTAHFSPVTQGNSNGVKTLRARDIFRPVNYFIQVDVRDSINLHCPRTSASATCKNVDQEDCIFPLPANVSFINYRYIHVNNLHHGL